MSFVPLQGITRWPKAPPRRRWLLWAGLVIALGVALWVLA
jgi:hypothetical protein